MNIGIDSVLARHSELAAIERDGRLVVLSISAGSYFCFNRTAAEIWTMLAVPRPVTRILDDLAKGHDVARDAIARDVFPFLQMLVDDRLAWVVHADEGL